MIEGMGSSSIHAGAEVGDRQGQCTVSKSVMVM